MIAQLEWNDRSGRPRFLEMFRSWMGLVLGALILLVVSVLYEVCKIEVDTGWQAVLIRKSGLELERDMEHLDENNPRHMAHMMKKMKEIMPAGSMPKEMDIAIKRLESGEDPEKIEEDMGDVLGGMMGDEGEGGEGGYGGGGYSRDQGLYDY